MATFRKEGDRKSTSELVNLRRPAAIVWLLSSGKRQGRRSFVLPFPRGGGVPALSCGVALPRDGTLMGPAQTLAMAAIDKLMARVPKAPAR